MQYTSDVCLFDLSVRIFRALDSNRVNIMSSDYV